MSSDENRVRFSCSCGCIKFKQHGVCNITDDLEIYTRLDTKTIESVTVERELANGDSDIAWENEIICEECGFVYQIGGGEVGDDADKSE